MLGALAVCMGTGVSRGILSGLDSVYDKVIVYKGLGDAADTPFAAAAAAAADTPFAPHNDGDTVYLSIIDLSRFSLSLFALTVMINKNIFFSSK